MAENEKTETGQAAAVDSEADGIQQESAEEPINAMDVVIAILLGITPVIALYLYEFVVSSTLDDLLPKIIYMTFYALTFIYIFLVAIKKNSFSYYTRIHLMRFVIAFAVGIALCIVQIYLPYSTWMYLPLAVILTVFSCTQAGIAAFFYLLFFQSMLSPPPTLVFFGFCLIGMIGILMFEYMDEDFLFGMPLFLSLMFETVLLLLIDLAVQGRLTFDSFLYTAINLFISFFALTLCLRYLSAQVIHKDSDRYQEINDPEYALLTELKKIKPDAYFHAIHTAYFCEKIAKKIGADVLLAKAGGYYHRIGRMRGKNNLKYALEIAQEHDFPPALVELLKEYGGKNTVLRSKEAAIVIFADAMISSVSFLFEKDSSSELDYGKIVNVVFQKQMTGGVLDKCQLTLEELTVIRKTFEEETLYYDFLR